MFSSNILAVAIGSYGRLGAAVLDPQGCVIGGFSARAADPGCGAENVPPALRQLSIQTTHKDIFSLQKDFQTWLLAQENLFALIDDTDIYQEAQYHLCDYSEMTNSDVYEWYIPRRCFHFLGCSRIILPRHLEIAGDDPSINRTEYVKDWLQEEGRNRDLSLFWEAKVIGLCLLRAYAKIKQQANSAKIKNRLLIRPLA